MGKCFLDTATKIGLDCSNSKLEKVAHKASEATGEFTGNKIADKNV